MAAPTLWAELGIEPTRDAAAIRRAYAAKLKTIPPDEDPQAFARLRQAYERALAWASLAPAPQAVPPRPDAKGPPPEPAQPSEPQASPTTPPATMTDLLRRRDVLDAARWLVEARRSMRLGLQEDLRSADQLGWMMARDLTLPPGQVREAAMLLGWTTPGNAAWAAPLKARLDAEAWLAELRRDDQSWARWLGAPGPIAARTLLGRGQVRLLPAMSRDRLLRKRYGEFLLHQAVVGDKFDPARVDALGAFMTRGVSRRAQLVSVLIMLILVPVTAGGAAGEQDPRLQGPVTGLVSIVGLGLAGLVSTV